MRTVLAVFLAVVFAVHPSAQLTYERIRESARDRPGDQYRCDVRIGAIRRRRTACDGNATIDRRRTAHGSV